MVVLPVASQLVGSVHRLSLTGFLCGFLYIQGHKLVGPLKALLRTVDGALGYRIMVINKQTKQSTKCVVCKKQKKKKKKIGRKLRSSTQYPMQ